MESERFDRLVQRAHEAASRRGVVRAGVGALAASAFVTLGLMEGAEARRQQKKGRKRRLICFQGETLVVRRRKRFLKQGATKGACPEDVCPADAPIACGDGCCPSNFSQCCDGVQGSTAAGSKSCNPTANTCCPANFGGGSCPPQMPQCCAPTEQDPFGDCAEMEGTCCPSDLGGGMCPSQAPVCCGPTMDMGYGAARVLKEFGYCCPGETTCCSSDEECPSGRECSEGCCFVIVTDGAGTRDRGRVAQAGGNRFRMAAS